MNKFYSPMLAERLNEKQAVNYKNGLEKLISSLEEKLIYNSDFNNLKSSLGSLVCSHFSDILRDDFWALSFRSDKVVDFYYKSVMSFHDVISAKKQADKLKAVYPEEAVYIEKCQKLCNELIDTALALKELKEYVVKGRKPSEKPSKPENENKVVKTCSCCFRSIAINKQGKIVHHGYQRFDGFQSASCFGQGYLSWEESDKGTIDYIEQLTKAKERKEKELIELPNEEVLYFTSRRKRESVKKGDPMFDKVKMRIKQDLEYQVRSYISHIEYLQYQISKRNK